MVVARISSFLVIYLLKAGIAQLVEQRTENPRVTSSNLVPGKNLLCELFMVFYKGIAVSGGKDSYTMAWFFCLFQKQAGWVHVNHNWSVESLNNAFLLHSFATGIKQKICILVIKRQKTETKSRELRYLSWLHIANSENYTSIETAHHANDSIESIIHFFLRGSLSTGIHSKLLILSTNFSNVKVVLNRPILHWTKEQIKALHWSWEIPCIKDLTNDMIYIRRNRIRTQLIPFLTFFL